MSGPHAKCCWYHTDRLEAQLAAAEARAQQMREALGAEESQLRRRMRMAHDGYDRVGIDACLSLVKRLMAALTPPGAGG